MKAFAFLLAWALASFAMRAGAESITAARYADPVDRYGHFALGRPHEYGRLVASTDAGRRLELALPQDEVFEDLQPRLIRLAAGAPQEVLAIASHRERGSRLVVIGVKSGRIEISAESPAIGTPNRWLNPVGIADLDGDGRAEIAAVITPHIGGTLKVYRRDRRHLVEIAALEGFSTMPTEAPSFGFRCRPPSGERRASSCPTRHGFGCGSSRCTAGASSRSRAAFSRRPSRARYSSSPLRPSRSACGTARGMSLRTPAQRPRASPSYRATACAATALEDQISAGVLERVTYARTEDDMESLATPASRHRAKVFLASCLILAVGAESTWAGGLLGDIINRVVPGAGTALDNAHRQIKEAIPPYKAAEEGASKVVNESLVQTGAPALQEMIARSRDDALRQGVRPIPQSIRENVAGFIPERVLNAARYRIQGGGDLTLQVNAIRYGEAQAIALDYVVVFKFENDALYNPSLWVHELTHVDQYQRWGLRDFSIRYLRNSEAVEREAYEAETRYAAWVAQRNSTSLASTASGSSLTQALNRPVARFAATKSSSTCGTAVTHCAVPGSAPVGTPCWCNTPFGPATGSLVPDSGLPAPVAHPVQQANACTTGQGSCPLGVALPVGAQCVCYTAQGNFPGQAQLRSTASACYTAAGACPLGVLLFSGDRCYCPSPQGFVWGQAN